MCKSGTYIEVEVTIQSGLSYTGKTRKKLDKIDSCIAPIVKALEDGDIMMIASCCGHGKTNGLINLADGRKLIII